MELEMELKRPEESVAAGYEGNPTADAGLLDQKEVLRSKRWYWCGRRAQDIFFSSLALLVLWPVILIFAIAVEIDSPGASPFFVQERIGRKGKPFKFIKLRSMCPNAEAKLESLLDQNEMDGPAFKIKDDPRITRVGRFIRKTSIDELPQLINILKGEMSIVGPRPPFSYVNNEIYLRRWLGTQRQRRRQGKLSTSRIERLEAIGMIWERSDSWEEHYREAQRYYAQHKDLEIPPNYVASSGAWLGKWFYLQRAARRKSEITKERVRRLDELGMRWEARRGAKSAPWALEQVEQIKSALG